MKMPEKWNMDKLKEKKETHIFFSYLILHTVSSFCEKILPRCMELRQTKRILTVRHVISKICNMQQITFPQHPKKIFGE